MTAMGAGCEWFGERLLRARIVTDIVRLEAGPRMSQAVIHQGVVYLAGQVALDAPGAAIAHQTRSILRRIDALLAAAGTDKSRMLSARVWLTDLRRFDEMNDVWSEWVSPGNTPTRVVVESRLAAPQFSVEIGVIAAR
jgi:enamine deaminase RidA (YjgF/YER057c/UK114 family)